MPSVQDARRPVEGPLEDEPGYVRRFIEAMDDDFNSAEAFAVIHDLVREGNKVLTAVEAGGDMADLVQVMESFLELTSVLGFRFPVSSGEDSELTSGLIDYLLELREDARKEKAFARADAIRDRITEMGVQVEDTPSGPRWRIGS